MRYEKIDPLDKYPYKIFNFITESPDRYITQHWHESGELLFCQSGELEVCLINSSYLMTKGDILFINSNQVHSSSSPVPGECLAMQFPLEFLKQITEKKYDTELLFNITPQEDAEELIRLLYFIKENFDDNNLAIRLRVQSKVYELFSILLTKYSISNVNIEEIKSQKYLKILEKVNQYILDNYQKNISIEEIASKFNYNPSYFSRFYKKFMGITYTEYLNSIRLESAYKELRDTDKIIIEIALDNGFNNTKTFYNVFYKQFGLSPQKYRKKYFKKSN